MKSPGLRIRTGPSRWPRPAARQFAILGGCLSLAAVLVLMHLRVYTTLSPIDELQHLDYVDSMTRFDIVRSGETVGPVAMREEACRGVDSPGFATPSCDAPVLRPEQFQESGINTAATHPPVYYLTTGAVAEVVDAVPGVESFLAAARLLWLGFGLALIFALARRLGANVMSAAGACLLLAATPAVLHSSTVLTNDAPSLVVGSLLFLAGLGVLERRLHPGWLAAAAALATSIKVTNIVAVGAVLFLLVLARERQSPRQGLDTDEGRAPGRWAPRWGAAAIVVVAGLLPPLT